MPVSVFSKNWYRVETLKPRLKSQVEISSHLYRGERWYVLREPVSGITQRFSWQAYALIGLMDGKRTLGQLWDRTADRLQKEMPTQDEVIGLVSALYQNDMAQLDVSANVVDMFQRRRKKERIKCRFR